MAYTTRRGTVAKKIRRGPGKRMMDGKSFRLADEVRYIQRRAADHDERVVSFGQIVVFSTASGDAWLLDASDHLAARLTRDGDPEPIEIKDTETTFSMVGRANTALREPPSSTRIGIPSAQSPSSVTRRASSLRWRNLGSVGKHRDRAIQTRIGTASVKISNMFG
jgi:hypothetical protein